jgi:hypothetical protein
MAHNLILFLEFWFTSTTAFKLPSTMQTTVNIATISEDKYRIGLIPCFITLLVPVCSGIYGNRDRINPTHEKVGQTNDLKDKIQYGTATGSASELTS